MRSTHPLVFVSSVLSILSVALVNTSCFSSRVRTQAQPAAEHYSVRQWFLGAVVPLTRPVGEDCGTRGAATVESKFGTSDVLISVGMNLLGAAAGIGLCQDPSDSSNEEQAKFAACVGAIATIATLSIATRTVTFTCAAEPMPITSPGVTLPNGVPPFDVAPIQPVDEGPATQPTTQPDL